MLGLTLTMQIHTHQARALCPSMASICRTDPVAGKYDQMLSFSEKRPDAPGINPDPDHAIPTNVVDKSMLNSMVPELDLNTGGFEQLDGRTVS